MLRVRELDDKYQEIKKQEHSLRQKGNKLIEEKVDINIPS